MVYLFDIKMAMIIFPFVALLITFPVLLWHYHRFGAVSRWSILMLYSFIFYLMCAYFLIILPLPSVAEVAKLTTPKYNLQPLMFVRQFIKYSPLQVTNIHTWIATIKSPTVIQPLFNVFLTIPFGFYLRAYFRKSWWQTLLMAFCLSLFFELTQLSGDYGFYPRPYRLFDVDDLLLNTTGGIVGFWLTRWVLPLLPTSEHITERLQIQSRQVSTFRHATALVVDLVSLSMVNSVLLIFASLARLTVESVAQPIALFALILVILLPQLLWHQTLGMRLVHLKVTTVSGELAPTKATITRWLIGYSMFILPAVIGSVAAVIDHTSILYSILGAVMFIYVAIVIIVFGLDLMIDLFRPSHALLFERWSKTRLQSSYA